MGTRPSYLLGLSLFLVVGVLIGINIKESNEAMVPVSSASPLNAATISSPREGFESYFSSDELGVMFRYPFRLGAAYMNTLDGSRYQNGGMVKGKQFFVAMLDNEGKIDPYFQVGGISADFVAPGEGSIDQDRFTDYRDGKCYGSTEMTKNESVDCEVYETPSGIKALVKENYLETLYGPNTIVSVPLNNGSGYTAITFAATDATAEEDSLLKSIVDTLVINQVR